MEGECMRKGVSILGIHGCLVVVHARQGGKGGLTARRQRKLFGYPNDSIMAKGKGRGGPFLCAGASSSFASCCLQFVGWMGVWGGREAVVQ